MSTAGRLLVALLASVAATAALPARAEHGASPPSAVSGAGVDGDSGGASDDGDDARPVSSPSELDGAERAPARPRRDARATTARSAPEARRVAAALPSERPATVAGVPGWHIVESGQTLSSIARLHGCAVSAVQQANRLDGTLIRPGQRLEVPACDPATRLAAIQLIAGQSVGQPWNGALHGGVSLPPGEGYFIRRPYRAFGASHVIGYVERAIAEVRRRFPGLHTLAIGDISARRGGAMTEHRSHQSGRDIDIGLFYTSVPRGYPQSFVTAVDSLDLAATWALLHAFARTADQPGGVSAIFLDFDVQGRLYDWALEHGVPSDYLARLLQYPHGVGAMTGLVRHEPNHADHMHVRFRCPPDDGRCG